jgi:hypothetical protein
MTGSPSLRNFGWPGARTQRSWSSRKTRTTGADCSSSATLLSVRSVRGGLSSAIRRVRTGEDSSDVATKRHTSTFTALTEFPGRACAYNSIRGARDEDRFVPVDRWGRRSIQFKDGGVAASSPESSSSETCIMTCRSLRELPSRPTGPRCEQHKTMTSRNENLLSQILLLHPR